MTKHSFKLSPLYLLLMLVAWPGVVMGYILIAHPTTPAACSSVVFWFLLWGSAVMVAYHPVIHLLDFLTPRGSLTGSAVPPAQTTQSRVALLYTVCDDFDPVALESCIQTAQQIGGQVYVLDDSRQRPVKQYVEDTAVRVVQRECPRAFKAGNINDAIRSQSLHEYYDYVVLADADEILLPNAAATLTMTLDANPDLAFVQLAHSSREDEVAWFAKVMRVMTDVKYRYYRQYANRYGLPLSHGHGVAIRLSLLKNGFPEIISEDIAMSADLRRAGHRGVFLAEPLCREATVKDLAIFCLRERRCMTADIECFVLKVMPLLFASGIGLIEKWDLLLRELRYPVKLLFPLTIIWAVLSSLWGWAGHNDQGLTGPVSKTCWVLVALIPWFSYFRFMGIHRIAAAFDFLLVSLPAHIGCLTVYLEGILIGLWRVIPGSQLKPDAWIWVPAGAKGRHTPSLLGDLLRYFISGSALTALGAMSSQWMLMAIGFCLLVQWLATRSSCNPRVGAIAVRAAGCGIMLALLMYVTSPESNCISDLMVLSLAVIIF